MIAAHMFYFEEAKWGFFDQVIIRVRHFVHSVMKISQAMNQKSLQLGQYTSHDVMMCGVMWNVKSYQHLCMQHIILQWSIWVHDIKYILYTWVYLHHNFISVLFNHIDYSNLYLSQLLKRFAELTVVIMYHTVYLSGVWWRRRSRRVRIIILNVTYSVLLRLPSHTQRIRYDNDTEEAYLILEGCFDFQKQNLPKWQTKSAETVLMPDMNVLVVWSHITNVLWQFLLQWRGVFLEPDSLLAVYVL